MQLSEDYTKPPHEMRIHVQCLNSLKRKYQEQLGSMPISEVKPRGQIKPSNIVCFPGKFTEFL